MTPCPNITTGEPRCSHQCPSWHGSWCVLAGRWTHVEARCPVVRLAERFVVVAEAAEDAHDAQGGRGR